MLRKMAVLLHARRMKRIFQQMPDGPVFPSPQEHRHITQTMRGEACDLFDVPDVDISDVDLDWLIDVPTDDDDLEPIEPGAFHAETDLFDVPGGDDDADWLEDAWLAQQQGEA